MYLKLTLRNVRRSALDYLLYIFTLAILMAIMSFSNCVSVFAKGIGFQTLALPILIVIITSILVNFINEFMIKQRSNEFATYILLGIEKEKLTSMFLLELMLLGLLCSLVGEIIGIVFFSIYYVGNLSSGVNDPLLEIIFKSSFQSLVYFLFMETISMMLTRRKICRLQIVELMREKRINQQLELGKIQPYGVTLLISSALFLLLFIGIFSDNKKISMLSVGFVLVPLLICIYAFFKWIYCRLGLARFKRSDFFYSGSRLYWIADLTSTSKTSANLNSIFCISMLFSEMSFIAGEFMLSDSDILAERVQQHMGFLQISISIIFIVIYFSILSLTQVMKLKNEVRNAELLFCMGKTRGEIKTLICSKLLVRLVFPALISFIILGTVAPFINCKLNSVLPSSLCNLLPKSLGEFSLCFVILYACYSAIIFVYINKAITKNIKR